MNGSYLKDVKHYYKDPVTKKFIEVYIGNGYYSEIQQKISDLMEKVKNGVTGEELEEWKKAHGYITEAKSDDNNTGA